MSNAWIAIAAGIALLLAAIPWVARIRHPEQKPLAAYLIFLFAFAATAFVLFGLLAWLATRLGLGSALEGTAPALLFLLLVLVPSLLVGTWQARKPPWRQGPPD